MIAVQGAMPPRTDPRRYVGTLGLPDSSELRVWAGPGAVLVETVDAGRIASEEVLLGWTSVHTRALELRASRSRIAIQLSGLLFEAWCLVCEPVRPEPRTIDAEWTPVQIEGVQ